MKNVRNFLGIASVLCVLALLSVPASAFPRQENGERSARINTHLNRLKEQGFDVSAIEAAIENEDQEAARRLMQQFIEEHSEELGIHAGGGLTENRMISAGSVN